MRKLSDYLEAYYEIQKDILLAYRPTNEGKGSSWSDRCMFREEGYSKIKPYNHRMTLDKEVVIEFDEDSLEDNSRMAEEVIKRLKQDGIKYSRWFSGSKSEHIHFFINPREATNLRLLKSVIMRHYCRGLEFKPDLQLAGNHLIRAEYGLNEKTGKPKTKLSESKDYPEIAEVPQEAWERYATEMNWLLKANLNRSVNELADSDLIKQLLDTTYITDTLKDGRTRILFVLANVLKNKYDKKELIDLLQKWYRYCNGRKLTPGQIAYQVYSAYRTDKAPGENYIQQLLMEIKD